MAGHNRLERQKLISPSGCCWSVQRNWDSHPTPSHQPADDLFYWGKWVVRAPPLFVNSYVWKILFSLCSCLTSDETTVFLPKSWFMMMSEWFSCWLCQLIQSPAGYRGIGKCWRNLQCKEGSAAIRKPKHECQWKDSPRPISWWFSVWVAVLGIKHQCRPFPLVSQDVVSWTPGARAGTRCAVKVWGWRQWYVQEHCSIIRVW